MQIRGFLDKNLGEILSKKSRNIQDSYQEFQVFLHWVFIKPNEKRFLPYDFDSEITFSISPFKMN